MDPAQRLERLAKERVAFAHWLDVAGKIIEQHPAPAERFLPRKISLPLTRAALVLETSPQRQARPLGANQALEIRAIDCRLEKVHAGPELASLHARHDAQEIVEMQRRHLRLVGQDLSVNGLMLVEVNGNIGCCSAR